MILHDLASICQDTLARLSHARILPSFMLDFGKIMQGSLDTRNCQDVLQDSCQVSCKILARSCKAVQRRNCQDVLQDSCQVSCKILARSWTVQSRNCQDVLQDSCQVSLQDFGKIMQGSPDKKLPRCVTRFLPSFLQD